MVSPKRESYRSRIDPAVLLEQRNRSTKYQSSLYYVPSHVTRGRDDPTFPGWSGILGDWYEPYERRKRRRRRGKERGREKGKERDTSRTLTHYP